MTAPPPWLQPPESMLDAHSLALCRLWQSGGRFGLLLVGDSWQREHVFCMLRPDGAPALTPSTTVADLTDGAPWGLGRRSVFERARRTALAVPSADLVDRDVAKLVDCDRILASAPDVESVDEALRSRLTSVIGLSVRPALRCRRLPTGRRDLLELVIDSLSANGLHDHVLDVGAVRCVSAAAADGGVSATHVLARNIVEPRLAPMTDVMLPELTAADESATSTPVGPPDPQVELSTEEADVVREPGPVEVTEFLAPPWATATTARGYANRRYPGRRGARTRARRGRAHRTVEYRADLGVDLPHTLRAIAVSGRCDASALRSAIRSRRAGRHTIVILDRSDSMNGLPGRAAAAMAIGAIEDAGRDRGPVSVISARGAGAELVVDWSRDVHEAQRTISTLPAGGGTPLASAFMLAAGLTQDDPLAGRAIVLTDGGSNVRLPLEVGGDDSRPALAQAEAALRVLVGLCEQVVVVPAANPGVRIRPDELEWLSRAGAVLA